MAEYERVPQRSENRGAELKSEAMLRTLLQSAPDAIIVVNAQGRIVLINTQAEVLFGYSWQQLLGQTVDSLLPERFRAGHGQHRAKYQADPLTRPMGSGLDLVARRQDGSEFPVEISLSPLPTDDGTLVISIVRDVTESKRTQDDLRRLNEELEQRVQRRTAQLEEANKELEAFAYSVSHDLRAPLRHLGGFATLLDKGAAGLDEKQRRYVSNIGEAAARMGQLIDDLLAFSRMGRAEMVHASVNLQQLVDEVLREVRPETEGRRLTWTIGALPGVEGDPAMLKVVMTNLIANAVKYTRQRDEATIEVGSYQRPGEVVVFVRDNGVGFDLQYVDKLFGVFQRLHRIEDFEGTGIGLATVRRIVNRHGGRVWAEGQEGVGATFSLGLPRQKEREDG